MKTRIAKLPANKLVTTLSTVRTELDALKEPQKTSQVSGVLGYQTVSSNTWDSTGTIGTDADTTQISTTFTITWTGDGSQSIAFAIIAVNLYVNGTDTAHQLTPAVNSWTDGTRSAAASFETLAPSGDVQAAEIFLNTLKAVTYYIKVHVYASCPGSFTVTT